MAMRQDWQTCDGSGRSPSEGGMGFRLSRRGLVASVGIGALGWLTSSTALSQVGLSPSRKGSQPNVLVVLFLRGGADGLSLVAPYREDPYYRERPNIALARPGKKGGLLDLDGSFGLHPSLESLLPFYREGHMAVVHACGSNDSTRSHFEAMSAMERGLAQEGQGPASGWVARYLEETAENGDSPLRALAIGDTMPDSLRGASHASVIRSVADYRLKVSDDKRAAALAQLADLYGDGNDAVSRAGRETIEVLKTIQDIPNDSAKREYPDSDLGRGLSEVATLIRADVGVEMACLDRGGWDTHVAQGGTSGWLPMLLDDLSKSLASFLNDLGRDRNRVTVVVMSEFGRRLAENGGLGTDHGHGGVLFALGGGIHGCRVTAKWPGLRESDLTGPGDLQVTTDYRDVLWELLAGRHGVTNPHAIFPGHVPIPVGLIG